MSPLVRYLLLQIPGWILVGFLLVWLWPKSGLSEWIAILGYGVWVAKDFALYPLLRLGYETNVPTGSAQLVGLEGIAREDLNPRGYIRVGGELWRAELVPGHRPISAGMPVRIESAESLTLFVSAVDRGH